MKPVLGAAVHVQAGGWQEAIEASCQPLLEAGAIEDRYVERCVAIVTEHGPYIVVAPGIALAHARPEDGVSLLGLSVASLAAPVEFGHEQNDPVDVVFAFSSPDRDQHVQLLSTLARAIVAGLDERVRQATNTAEARSVLEDVMIDV